MLRRFLLFFRSKMVFLLNLKKNKYIYELVVNNNEKRSGLVIFVFFCKKIKKNLPYNFENKTMVHQVSTRFLDHGISFWKKLRFHLKKPWSIEKVK